MDRSNHKVLIPVDEYEELIKESDEATKTVALYNKVLVGVLLKFGLGNLIVMDTDIALANGTVIKFVRGESQGQPVVQIVHPITES